MTTVKPSYAASAALTITLDGLAASSIYGRQSAVVDNTTNLYDDALLGVTIVTPASGTLSSTSPNVTVYLYAAMDATPHYTDGASGSDAAFTMPSQPNLIPFMVIGVGSASQALSGALTVYAGPRSVAAAFGGVLPSKWGIVAVNNLGVALGTGNAAAANGVTFTAA